MKNYLFLIFVVFNTSLFAGTQNPNEPTDGKLKCPNGEDVQFGKYCKDGPIDKLPPTTKSDSDSWLQYFKSKCSPCFTENKTFFDLEKEHKVTYECTGYKCEGSKPNESPAEICMKNGGIWFEGRCYFNPGDTGGPVDNLS